jgi:anti-sigma regulatory factor (Ser/Thr protein kinase)
MEFSVRTIDFALPAAPSSVAWARRALAAFAARCGIEDVWPVQIAVSEAVGNAVLHAYPDGDSAAEVRLRAECDTEELVVLIDDNGTGMRPRLDSPGLGLGISLMEHAAGRLVIEDRPQGGMRVELRFAVREPRAALAV